MAGGRSLGCATCKARRIKCDERKPTCQQCEKARRHCPGVSSPFRYQYGSQTQYDQLSQALSIRTESAKHIQFGIDPEEEPPNPRDEEILIHPTDQGTGSVILHTDYSSLQEMLQCVSPVESSIPAEVAMTSAQRLSALWLRALYEWPETKLQLRLVGFYIYEIPQRLGYNPALDAAAKCFYYAIEGFETKPSQDAAELRVYGDVTGCGLHDSQLKSTLTTPLTGEALAKLREALQHPTSAQTAETLAASLLLYQYEIYKWANATWFKVIHLSGGVAAIIQSWGPHRMTSPFVISILRAHFQSMIMHSILKGETCCLEDPAWHTTMRLFTDIHPVLVDLWICLTRLTRILCDLRSVSSDQADIVRRMYDWRQTILIHESEIKNDLAHPGVYRNVPSIYTGSIPPPGGGEDSGLGDDDLVLMGKQIIRRAVFFNVCVIVANVILERLGASSSSDLKTQSKRSADFIKDAFALHLTETSFLIHASWLTTVPVAYGISCDEVQRYYLTALAARLVRHKSIVNHQYMEAVFEPWTGGALLAQGIRY